MEQFTELFRNATIGVLHGFDRIVFQGFLMPLMYANEAMGFFDRRGMLLPSKTLEKFTFFNFHEIIASS